MAAVRVLAGSSVKAGEVITIVWNGKILGPADTADVTDQLRTDQEGGISVHHTGRRQES